MQLKSCIFTLFLFGVVSALGCGEDDHAKKSLQSSSPKTESHSEVATVKPLSQAELKSFEQVYAQRSSEKLPMTVGMLRSSMFSSYNDRYGFPLCNQPEIMRLSRESAIEKLDNLKRRFGKTGERSAGNVGSMIETLKALVKIQPDEYAPLLMKGSEITALAHVSSKQPLDDLMFVPFAPNAAKLLKEALLVTREDEKTSLSLNGFGTSIFLPSEFKSYPGLPKGTKVLCSYFTGKESRKDYCCSCSPKAELAEDCSKFTNKCESVDSCCGGKNAFWSDPFGVCGAIDNPEVDPRVWLDTKSITSIGLAE